MLGPKITRREVIAAGASIVAGVGAAACAHGDDDVLRRPMPKRTLGKTREKVSVIGFGSAPMGHSFQPQELFDRVVGEALDLGINYMDTATIYDAAQERLGPIVKRNRARIFLTTKTVAKDRAAALKAIEENLRLLQTDHVDLAMLHNIGDFDTARLMDENSALSGLLEGRKRGLLRFVGVSGHQRVAKMTEAMRTGALDVVMPPINYVDRYIYGFEADVLPEARKRRMGVVAMKVLGGAPGFRYRQPIPCLIPSDRVDRAIRYVLGTPGVTTAVIGFNFVEQVRQAVTVAKSFRPLSAAEAASLSAEGKELVASWGLHLGPV